MNRWKILVFAILFCMGFVCYAWYPIPPVDGGPANKVIVVKHEHRMTVYRGDQELRIYHIALGRVPFGPKSRAGDHKTPEGAYLLDSKNPRSAFHLAMHVSYPNAADREHAATEKVDPGALIMVHGIKNGWGWIGRWHRLVDWTDGCIALTNAEMDQFDQLVPPGTPIEIRP